MRCIEGLPFCIYEGLEVHIVPPALEAIRHTVVKSVESVDDSGCVLLLDGVEDINDAELLVGRYLLAEEENLDLDPEEDMILVVGRQVVSDEGRALGVVTEYLETKANDVLVVERTDGSELLIPIIEETIVEVSGSSDDPIVVHLLEGLEEL